MDDLERKFRDQQIKSLKEEIEEIYIQWESTISDEQRLILQRRIDQKFDQIKKLRASVNKKQQEDRNSYSHPKQQNQPLTISNLPSSSQTNQSAHNGFLGTAIIIGVISGVVSIISQITKPINLLPIIRLPSATSSPSSETTSVIPTTTSSPSSPSSETTSVIPTTTSSPSSPSSETSSVIPTTTSSPSPKEIVSSKIATDFFNNGLKKYKEKDFKGAIADYNEAIRLNYPNLAGVYHNRFLAKYSFGDKQGARADYNEAIRLNPDISEAYRRTNLIFD